MLLKHIEAIIHPMTPIERSKPSVIDVKRKNRIKKGSGTKIEQNQLMKQFDQMSKMMKMMQGPGGKDEDDGRHERNARRNAE
jgi:signal recognition particle subunit SRP54